MKKWIIRIISFILWVIILLCLFLIGKFYYEQYRLSKAEAANLGLAKDTFTKELCEANKVTTSSETIDLDSFGYDNVIGYMKSDAVDLEASILRGNPENDQMSAMNYGVSIDPYGGVPNDDILYEPVILGHRNMSFKKLKDLKVGDTIILNLDNTAYVYEVYETEVIFPTETDKVFFDGEGEQLVLYTCWPFVQYAPTDHRFVVKAKMISETKC